MKSCERLARQRSRFDMGSDAYVYVGPYFRCFTALVEKPKVVHNTCTNQKCISYGKQLYPDISGPFCPRCGQPCGNVTIIVKRPAVDCGSVCDAFERPSNGTPAMLTALRDSCSPIAKVNDGEIHIWIGNMRNDSMRKFNMAVESNASEVKLEEDAIKTEKALFLTHYSKEYAVLEKLYGKENVKVCWGIMNYSW